MNFNDEFCRAVEAQAFECDEVHLFTLLDAGSLTSYRMANLWEDENECAAELCQFYPDCVAAVRRLWLVADAFNAWSVGRAVKDLDLPNTGLSSTQDVGAQEVVLKRSGPLPTPCRQADKRKRLGKAVSVDDTRSEKERTQMMEAIIGCGMSRYGSTRLHVFRIGAYKPIWAQVRSNYYYSGLGPRGFDSVARGNNWLILSDPLKAILIRGVVTGYYITAATTGGLARDFSVSKAQRGPLVAWLFWCTTLRT